MRASLFRFIVSLAFSALLLATVSPGRSQSPESPAEAGGQDVVTRHKDERRLKVLLGSIPTRAGAVNLAQRIEYKLFQNFQREIRADYPNVEFISSTPLQFIGIQGGGENRLLLQMASQTAPVTIGFPVKAFDTYCDQNFMLPLNPFLERPENAWVREHLERYQVLTDVLTREGIVYAIPTEVRTMGIHYRKDLFRDAGIERPPATWDEFRETLVALRNPEKGIYGWGVANDGPAIAWWFINFIWQAGSEVVEQTEDGPRAAFDNERGAQALDFLRSLFRDDLVLRSGRTFELFSQGKVGMVFSYVGSESNQPNESADVDPLLLGVAPLPEGPDGHTGAEINGAMVAVNSQIEDETVREIAFRYLVHKITPDSRRLIMREYAEAGLAKYFTRDALRQAGLTEFIDQVSPEWDRQAGGILATAKPEPHGPGVRVIYQDMGYYIDRALSNPSIDSLAILRECADAFNQKLGALPREEVARRERNVWVGLIVGAVLWIAFIYVTGKMLSGTLKSRGESALEATGTPSSRLRRWRVTVSAWAFMFPALFLILIWGYYPLIKGSVMAFQDYKIIGDSSWSGIQNFVDVAYGDTFRTALYNTILYAILSMGLGFFVPILLALALDEIPRYKRLYRTIYYMPAVTTGLVIMFLWKWFYDPSPEGLINQLLASLAATVNDAGRFIGGPQAAPLWNFQAVDWLGGPTRVLGFIPVPMIALLLPQIWAGAGPGCLIYLAALKSIPDDLYEAAEVDGAGFIRKIWNITTPMLLPLILINFIGAFVGTFQSMGNILVMTGGGPERMTHVLGLEIWYAAFMYLEFGYATAVAWVVGSLLVGFTIFKLNILRKAQFRAAHKVEV